MRAIKVFLIYEYLPQELSFMFVDLLWIGVRRCFLAVVNLLFKLLFLCNFLFVGLGILSLVF